MDSLIVVLNDLVADEDEGRRERKKRETRAALVEAALVLFAEHGVDAVSVEQIADRVDVSARTFHRYFASKDDVLFADSQERRESFAAALGARPNDEPILASLLEASLELVALMAAHPEHETLRSRLVEGTPSLQARSLAATELWSGVVVEYCASRLGLTPADRLPQLLAVCTMGALRTARRRWNDNPSLDLAEEFRLAFAAVSDLSAASASSPPAARRGRRR